MEGLRATKIAELPYQDRELNTIWLHLSLNAQRNFHKFISSKSIERGSLVNNNPEAWMRTAEQRS